MEAKRIKQNMVQGEWIPGNDYGAIVSLKNADSTDIELYGGEFVCESASNTDIVAICEAVNGTWNQNINPSAVVDMLLLIERAAKHYQIAGEDYWYNDCITVLNRAKL